jgi:Ras-related GTP-binding protein C/D
MQPNLTLFLESTTKIMKDNINSFIDFQVWDFPGQIDFFDPTFDLDSIFGEMGALIFVIDAVDDYQGALNKLHFTITRALAVNPSIHLEVFIHKVDTLTTDYQQDIKRDIQQRVGDELADVGLVDVPIEYHMTSIFDHSIFEAFSKIIQKLIPQLHTLQDLLNNLVDTTDIQKAFLFDVISKIYIATDRSPVDIPSYEICSDFIDVVIDISDIYGTYERRDVDGGTDEGETSSIMRIKKEDVDKKNNSTSAFHAEKPDTVLYLREINKCLALICILPNKAMEDHGLLEYNVQCFKDAIQSIFGLQGR